MDFSRIEGIVEEVFSRSTVKMGYLMESNDTDEMLTGYRKYKNAIDENDTLTQYSELSSSDFDGTELEQSARELDRIICMASPKLVATYLTEEECKLVLSNARKRFISSYVEKNTYVRIFAGLPSLTDVEYVYVSSEYAEYASTTTPIHELSDSEIEVLYTKGVLTELAKKYPKKTYISYLHRRASIEAIREANDFAMITAGVVDGEEELSAKFHEYWEINRKAFDKAHHNIFYQRTTTYYESFVVMLLAWSTRMDLIRDSGFDIENDYYDDYELAAIFNDYGISMDTVDVDTRRKVAMNLPLLIRNRGTNKVLENLADIFNVKNIYNYVIQKLYVNGNPVIRCHAVPVKDMKNVRKYLTREYGYISYDKLISNDSTFSDKHLSNVTTRNLETALTDNGYVNTYHALLNKDFSYIHSKYVAVDNFIDMSQTSLDFSLFYNTLLESDIGLQNISVKHKLRNFDMSILQVYAYLCSLLATKYKFVDNIPSTPSEMKYVVGLNHKINFSKIEVPLSDIQVTTSLDYEVVDLLRIFEANFSGTDYMFMLSDWLMYNSTGSLNDFLEVYSKDRRLLHTLREIMSETVDNDQYMICKQVLEYSTRLNAKNSTFGTSTTYTDYLKNVNVSAYNNLKRMKNETSDTDWSETYSDEIVYVLKLMRSLIESLNDDEYVDAVSFLDDIRDTQTNELKNVLSYLVDYFTSMTTTVRDPEFTYDIGDELDSFRVRENLHRTHSNKYVNDFNTKTDNIEISRILDIPEDNFLIKDALFLAYTNSRGYSRLIQIGGDHETN